MFAMNASEEEEYETPRDKACAMLMGLIVMATGRMVSPNSVSSVVDSIIESAQRVHPEDIDVTIPFSALVAQKGAKK